MPAEATNDVMNYVLFGLLAVFVGAVVLQVGLNLVSSRRRVCPDCGNKSLRCVQWVRESVVVDGEKTPDVRSYFLCGSCGARLRKGPAADFTAASELEWRKYCTMK